MIQQDHIMSRATFKSHHTHDRHPERRFPRNLVKGISHILWKFRALVGYKRPGHSPTRLMEDAWSHHIDAQPFLQS